MAAKTRQVAYVDPSDPSVLYLSQPTAVAGSEERTNFQIDEPSAPPPEGQGGTAFAPFWRARPWQTPLNRRCFDVFCMYIPPFRCLPSMPRSCSSAQQRQLPHQLSPLYSMV